MAAIFFFFLPFKFLNGFSTRMFGIRAPTVVGFQAVFGTRCNVFAKRLKHVGRRGLVGLKKKD